MSQTASLVLKSSDLTFGSSTTVGTADANGTTLTWNNINLRVLLGDMYDQYDRFNLNLNTIATNQAAVIGTAADDRACYITIAGLPWVNNTYNQKTSSNTNTTVIASCVFTSQGQTTQYYYGNNTTTFIKNQDVCNITISIRKILDDASPSTANAFPKIMFIFDIEGVEAYKVKDITQARILK
jgi:hypothetical protein